MNSGGAGGTWHSVALTQRQHGYCNWKPTQGNVLQVAWLRSFVALDACACFPLRGGERMNRVGIVEGATVAEVWTWQQKLPSRIPAYTYVTAHPAWL